MAQADTHTDAPFKPTIRDIADLAGVSIATVSRVLNDRPDVAPGTRETVLQVVREHGFSTNRGARALSSGRTGMIGLMLPLVGDAYFGPLLEGIAAIEQRVRALAEGRPIPAAPPRVLAALVAASALPPVALLGMVLILAPSAWITRRTRLPEPP